MNGDYVDFHQAQLLRELGFPQEQPPSGSDKGHGWWHGHLVGYFPSDSDWKAAPTLLPALDWCEEQGYRWEREAGRWRAYTAELKDVRYEDGRYYESASALLDAILEQMTATREKAQGRRTRASD